MANTTATSHTFKFVIAENLKAFLNFLGNYIEDGTFDNDLDLDIESGIFMIQGIIGGHLIDGLRRVVIEGVNPALSDL